MPLSSDEISLLIDRHAVALQLWIGGQKSSAEDIVQEAFCRLSVLRSPPDHPVAWLYRVCRNLSTNERVSSRRRQARERKTASCVSYDADPAQQLFAIEASHAVLNLPDELREVVVARIWGQLTMEQVGALCEISTATASRRYAEALTQLRILLDRPSEVIRR